MKSILGAKAEITIGKPVVIESQTNDLPHGVVFEDDGDTGYVYALDMTHQNPIVDALHIYVVQNVADRNIPSDLTIVWSHDWMRAALFLNNYPHAVVNFATKEGSCRENVPDVSFSTGWRRTKWSDSLLDYFNLGPK